MCYRMTAEDMITIGLLTVVPFGLVVVGILYYAWKKSKKRKP